MSDNLSYRAQKRGRSGGPVAGRGVGVQAGNAGTGSRGDDMCGLIAIALVAAMLTPTPATASEAATIEQCRAAYARSLAARACADRLDVHVYPDGRCRFWNTCPVAETGLFVQTFILVPLHEVPGIRLCDNGEIRLNC